LLQYLTLYRSRSKNISAHYISTSIVLFCCEPYRPNDRGSLSLISRMEHKQMHCTKSSERKAFLLFLSLTHGHILEGLGGGARWVFSFKSSFCCHPPPEPGTSIVAYSCFRLAVVRFHFTHRVLSQKITFLLRFQLRDYFEICTLSKYADTADAVRILCHYLSTL
jgi:hypothetical protein